MQKQEQILLFDGVCNLCNKMVSFVIKRDPHAKIKLTSLQSAVGKKIITVNKAPADISTVVFVDSGKVYTESSAVIKVLRYLKFPWPLLRIFWLIPKFLRDWLYVLIAKNRYKIFGKRKTCRLPNPEEKKHFL
jgi:predicted DCC family thiol-disulfide oxidoreductase YuxK